MTIIGNLLVTMKQLVMHLKEVLNEKHLQSIEETTANYFLLDQYRLFYFYSKKVDLDNNSGLQIKCLKFPR